jgi:hypothetical protein
MPKKFEEAIKNIRKIIETPLNKNLNDVERKIAEKEIQEALGFIEGTFKTGDGKDEKGFIPTPLT